MAFDFERQFTRYLRLFESQDFDERLIDDTQVDRHIGFLGQLAAVENSSGRVTVPPRASALR